MRAALDSAADVVIFDTVATLIPVDGADEEIAATYVARVGWDPRSQSGDWSLITLTPSRIRAWKGVGEIDGRTIMRNSTWVE